jgi:hypothetical protein
MDVLDPKQLTRCIDRYPMPRASKGMTVRYQSPPVIAPEIGSLNIEDQIAIGFNLGIQASRSIARRHRTVLISTGTVPNDVIAIGQKNTRGARTVRHR